MEPELIEDAPRVGAPSDEYRAVCVYSSAPGEPQCNATARLHVMVNSGNYGVVMLATCDSHALIARMSGAFLQEHAFQGYCGLPSTRWSPANVCVLDDSGQEPARVGYGSVAAPIR